MFLLIPFTYIFLCLLSTMMLRKTYAVGFWPMLALNIVFTPFIIFVASIFFPKYPKAYCMLPFDTFRVGESYNYKFKKRKRLVIIVNHDGAYEISRNTFNRHFSQVIEKKTEPSDSSVFKPRKNRK